MSTNLIILVLVGTFMCCSSDCSMFNDCNSHGYCVPQSSSCDCYEGYGAATDVTLYRAPDCSARTCPSGLAWADVPTSTSNAHFPSECSNRGTCDRVLGLCNCFVGFEGAGCQRTSCPNGCSGHGVCVSIKQMAQMSNALPLGPNTFYEGDQDATTWDEEKSFGCVCDSSWSVGLASGETQEPEFFGPDCSQRHCPSADDPRTAQIETDCQDVTAQDSIYKGQAGNLCQVDCANRGLCDYTTGFCRCFNGQYGPDCSIINQNAVYEHWNEL